MNNKNVILCDLGGVLIDLNWEESARILFGKNLSKDRLREMWLSISAIVEFESGKCTFKEFYESFISELKSELSFAEFKEGFEAIIGPEKPNCKQILEELKDLGTLALLSNTNRIHIEKLRKGSSMLEIFDNLFLSYEMGKTKPSADVFHEVCSKLQVVPKQIFFFDDSPQNIKGAKSIGYNAYQVESPAEILEIVKNRRINAGNN
ncbi:MAG: glucose-1-phosphatase [Candidatus Rifleibacteriota bacterium]